MTRIELSTGRQQMATTSTVTTGTRSCWTKSYKSTTRTPGIIHSSQKWRSHRPKKNADLGSNAHDEAARHHIRESSLGKLLTLYFQAHHKTFHLTFLIWSCFPIIKVANVVEEQHVFVADTDRQVSATVIRYHVEWVTNIDRQ
jgi:hypothetical protein